VLICWKKISLIGTEVYSHIASFQERRKKTITVLLMRQIVGITLAPKSRYIWAYSSIVNKFCFPISMTQQRTRQLKVSRWSGLLEVCPTIYVFYLASTEGWEPFISNRYIIEQTSLAQCGKPEHHIQLLGIWKQCE